MKTHTDTLIVGAGIAGLMAARALADAGGDVILLDKGRGVGGRMATRRFADARFDHGAQFISVRSPEFQTVVDGWIDAGVATLWSHGFADGLTGDGSLLTAAAGGGVTAHTPARDGHPRYRGVPGMTAIPKHVARGLDVRLGVQATAVRRLDDGWEIDADAGRRYRARSVVLTAPVPQTLALLAAGSVPMDPPARRSLEEIDYAPCLVLLGVAESEFELPDPGVLRRATDDVEWIADNTRKRVSERGPALTVHFSPTFSRAHYEEDDETVLAAMLEALEPVGVPAMPEKQVKRWRFSRPENPLACEVWKEGLPPGIVIAGDAFLGARVEGAVRSGLAAARAIA